MRPSTRSATTNEAERREALAGFVFSPFRAEDFLSGIVTGKSYQDIEFKIFDGPEAKPEACFTVRRLRTVRRRPVLNRFVATTNLSVAGRPWTISYASRPGFDVAFSRTWIPYTLIAGILISFLFFVVTGSQMRARDKAERSEMAVKESEERYRELVENANDIVFTLDLAGNVTSVNKAVESVTGYKQSELLGMNMSEFLTPVSTESARRMTQIKLAGQERTNYEVEVRAKDGRLFTLEISSRLAVNQGKPAGVQGVARDITTRRQAEALRQADQRALSEYERLLERVTGLSQTLGTARDLLAIFRGLREFTLASVP